MIKTHLKKITYFAVFLLLVNSGLSAAAYTISSTASDGSERILLCTSQGFKWVSLSELNAGDAGDLSSASDINSSQHCPFCSINAHSIASALDNTALSASLNPDSRQLHRVDLIDSTLYQHDRLAHLPSRAPPVFS